MNKCLLLARKRRTGSRLEEMVKTRVWVEKLARGKDGIELPERVDVGLEGMAERLNARAESQGGEAEGQSGDAAAAGDEAKDEDAMET